VGLYSGSGKQVVVDIGKDVANRLARQDRAPACGLYVDVTPVKVAERLDNFGVKI
jgi:hypothetical protein